METKRTWFFNQRIKYLIVIGATLFPIVSIMFVVFLTAYQPVFTSLEEMATKGATEMYPLRKLQVALLEVIVPPDNYLLYGSDAERREWDRLTGKVEDGFSMLMSEGLLPSHQAFFLALKQQWDSARKKGDTLIQSPHRYSTPQRLSDVMTQFDAQIGRISIQVAQLADDINNDIQANYRNIRKLKIRGIVFTGSAILLGLIVGLAGSIWLTREREKIVDQSLRDTLTGVHNRRGIEQELLKMQRHQLSYSPPCFSILMMDLDKFKQINDRYGHDVGDLVLKHFAEVTRKTIRNDDAFGRFGGEEFLALLPGTDIEQARILAERIRQEIESTTVEFPDSDQRIAMTVSIGCTTFSEKSEKVGDALKRADEAMYCAKEAGRNRVICG